MGQLDTLFIEFERWLKRNKGMHSKQGIAKKRKKIVNLSQRIVHQIFKESPSSIKDPIELANKCELKLQNLNDEDKDSLNHFIEFLQNKEFLISEPNDSDNTNIISEEIKPSESTISTQKKDETPEERKIIGRVALTMKSVAKPTEFEFWAEDKPDLHIEIGSIITAKGKINSEEVNIIGIVTDMYATSATESPIEDFYSTGYGDASVEPSTARPVVRVVKVTIVYRTDGRFEPPLSNWPVYFATKEEIIEAYNAEVPKEYSILSGFTWDDKRSPVPIYIDSRFLLGYEGAHVNISGASGLATKTSYALFLIFSIMGKVMKDMNDDTNKNKLSVAAILFNVKEADLMRIDEGPENWSKLFELLENDDDKSYNLWEASKDEGLDPFAIRSKLKFYAPPRPDDSKKPLTFRKQGKQLEIYSYGLKDLTGIEGVALSSLLDPEDLDEKTLGLISSLYDEIKIKNINSFKDLLEHIKKLKPENREWFTIGYGIHHMATLNKVRSRLTQAITHQLRGLLLQTDANGKPVPIEQIKSGDIWVVDISKLHSKGQRLVFMHIYETINKLLEAKKNKESEIELGTKTVPLNDFPDRIIVFVDELNKFAPSSRGGSSIKSSVVDITARGRSIGLSLIGAQQVANQIDEEILSNTSTFVVGRSHAISLKGDVFHWLQEGLKDKAMVLPKGEMILWHAVHSRPVLISFPKPIHFYSE